MLITRHIFHKQLNGDEVVVKSLFDNKADIESKSNSSKTPLPLVTEKCHAAVV